MAEFLGIERPAGDATNAVFMIGDEHYTDYRNVQKLNALPCGLEQDFEVFRSLWDSMSRLVDLDNEYINFDFPAEPTYTLIEPSF